MSSCPICGTRTGQHGFSWDKGKWPQPKLQFVTLIPKVEFTEDEDEASG